MEKTNVSRLLDSKKINYIMHEYDKNATDGMTISSLLNKDPNQVFKTLVTRANTNEYFVFVIPVCKNLDLKLAAKLANVKSIQMILQKELLPLTGYIHGGCSPIGMKKRFKTFVDESALKYDTILFSAGKVGYNLEASPNEIGKFVELKFGNLCL